MDWIPVNDPGDPRLAVYLGLRDHALRQHRESRGGDLAGVFIAEGDIVVERALRAGYRLLHALVDGSRTAPLPGLVDENVPIFAAAVPVIERITGMGVHRGMLACFERRPLASLAAVLSNSRRVVVAEGVNNPTNVGVIVRSAAALGVDALLLDPTCSDPLYRRASRVSMGEVFRFPYARTDPLPDGLRPLREAGFLLVALTPAPDAIDIAAVPTHDRIALVLGAEGHGITEPTMAAADLRARIPMHCDVDSLNVGSAAAVACYALMQIR
jgi:tRNA(Leu) C34 or U34 (ribose-2'-O)-methylase TrmL